MKRYIFFLASLIVLLTACQSRKRYSDEQLQQGRLSGKFSVSEDQQVYFSQGNLQYCPATKTYRFAANQLTVIGSMNDSISRNYDGYIDLFGSGTGKHPASFGTVDLFYRQFDDWGLNPISNGGDEGGIWRTLTKTEWNYLLYHRPNAKQLATVGFVNDSNLVVILFPDGYHAQPSSFVPLMDTVSFNVLHRYSSSETQTLQQEGVVLLPAAGHRQGVPDDLISTAVSHVGDECAYWFAPDTTESGYNWRAREEVPYDKHLITLNLVIISENALFSATGLAVRLVQDVRNK